MRENHPCCFDAWNFVETFKENLSVCIFGGGGMGVFLSKPKPDEADLIGLQKFRRGE